MSWQARWSWRTLPKPGGEGDVGDGQVGVVEQAAGEVGPAGAGQRVGRHAQVLGEQAPEVAGRDADAGAEVGLGAVVEGAGEDELDGPADELGPDADTVPATR